jgi:hypothetical protein
MEFKDLKRGQVINVRATGPTIGGGWDEYYLIIKPGKDFTQAISYDALKKEFGPYLMGLEEWNEEYSHFGDAKLATQEQKLMLQKIQWQHLLLKDIFKNQKIKQIDMTGKSFYADKWRVLYQ